MYEHLSKLLEEAKTRSLTKHEKHFAKWCLCWQFNEVSSVNVHMLGKDYYKMLQTKATEMMNHLAAPLHQEYARLQKAKSDLLKLSLSDKYASDPKLASNRELLKKHYTLSILSLSLSLCSL